MKKRVISGIVLGIAVLICLPSMYTRVLFVLVFGCVSAIEYAVNLEKNGIHVTLWVLLGYLGVSAFLSCIKAGMMTYLCVYTAAIFLSMFSGIIHERVSGKGAVYTTSALSYPCFLFMMMMYVMTTERWFQVLLLGGIGSVFCDIFALLFGMKFGRHKLAPVVSPKKSIEGSVAGTIFAMLAGLLYYLIFKNTSYALPLYVCLITTFVSALCGMIGDLSESLLKRYLDIKDFSDYIPGHGGFMDRADALLFALPASYFCLYLLGC